MKLKERFHIVPFTNPSGEQVYRLDGKDKDGKRVRKNFPSEAEAKAERQRLEAEIENLPTVPLQATRLTSDQLQEAEWAFAELDGKPLMAAIRFYLDNYRDPVNKRPLADAYADFLKAKESENLRPDSIRNLRGRVGLFSRMNPGKMVSDILPDHVREFLSRPNTSPRNRINDRAALSNFFNWAWKEKQYCQSNPASVLKRAETDEADPQVLSVADARKLIETAATFKDGKLVPYVALCLFCAIRPDKEIGRISWNQIDLEKKTIRITGKEAKMRGKRIVEISDNCLEWLLPHAAKRTPFKGANFRKDWDRLRALCGFGAESEEQPELKPWVQDYLRHTAISHHFQKTGHEGLTAKWAGNSPDVIQKHYKGLVTAEECAEFWSISPSDAARKVLRMKAA